MVEFVPPIISNCGLFLECHFVQHAAEIAARLCQGPGPSSQPAGNNAFSCNADFRPMDPDTQRQKRREVVLSSLNAAIEVSNVAREACSITPAKVVFGSFSLILTMNRVGLSTLPVLIDRRPIECI